jgi:hypothetical protein
MKLNGIFPVLGQVLICVCVCVHVCVCVKEKEIELNNNPIYTKIVECKVDIYITSCTVYLNTKCF